MTNEPTDTYPTHDEIAPDPGDEAHPDILRITALPAGKAHAESRNRLSGGKPVRTLNRLGPEW